MTEGLRPGTEGGEKIGASHAPEIETPGGTGKIETGRRAEAGDTAVKETETSEILGPGERYVQNDQI